MHPIEESHPQRPPRHKSERRRRGHIVVVRLDGDEFERIQAEARMADSTSASYLRACGLKRPTTPKRLNTEFAPADMRKLLAEVNMIGSNLNQLARRSNSGASVDAAEIETALSDLAFMRVHIRSVLGLPPS